MQAMLTRAAMMAALLGAAVLGATGSARAGTPAEDASAATKQWAKAIMELDVDTQMKMLPKKLFATPEAQQRERRNRQHDKELSIINGEKWLSFDVQPTGQLGKVGNLLVMVFPYRSVKQTREGKLQRDSALLAVAEEGSSDWSVIDGSGQSHRSIKVYVPGYAGLPALPQPTTKVLSQ